MLIPAFLVLACAPDEPETQRRPGGDTGEEIAADDTAAPDDTGDDTGADSGSDSDSAGNADSDDDSDSGNDSTSDSEDSAPDSPVDTGPTEPVCDPAASVELVGLEVSCSGDLWSFAVETSGEVGDISVGLALYEKQAGGGYTFKDQESFDTRSAAGAEHLLTLTDCCFEATNIDFGSVHGSCATGQVVLTILNVSSTGKTLDYYVAGPAAAAFASGTSPAEWTGAAPTCP